MYHGLDRTEIRRAYAPVYFIQFAPAPMVTGISSVPIFALL
jgi:hypothetical protein